MRKIIEANKLVLALFVSSGLIACGSSSSSDDEHTDASSSSSLSSDQSSSESSASSAASEDHASSSSESSTSSESSASSESSQSSESSASSESSDADQSSSESSSSSSEPAVPEAETWSFYADGLGTLTLMVDGDDASSELTPGQFGAVASNAAGTGSDGQTVWEVQFNDTTASNVFLGVEGTPFSEGLTMNSVMREYGEVQFDIYVDAIEPETRLVVKLDSGWPSVSEYALETPEVGEWVSVSVLVADFVDNTIEPGSADLERIVNAFVLEAADGTAMVHLNNIQYACAAEDCTLEAVQPPPADDETAPGDMALEQIRFEALAGGGARFSIRLPEEQHDLHLFARRESAQDFVVNHINQIDDAVTDNGDGSFTYAVEREEGYTEGDLVEVRFFGASDSGATPYPGPADTDWLSLTYADGIVVDGVGDDDNGDNGDDENGDGDNGSDDAGHGEIPGDIDEVMITQLDNGAVRFSIRLGERKDDVSLFARRNNGQDHVVNHIQQTPSNEIDNGDGSWTYVNVREDAPYEAGDLIEARFYTFSPESGQVFYPGPTDGDWVEVTFAD